MTNEARTFAQSSMLLIVAAAALYAAAQNYVGEGAAAVLWIIAGLFTGSFLQVVPESFRSTGSKLLRIDFDPQTSREALDAIPAEFVELEPEVRPKWEPSSNDLLVHDPALALARLRIDIERELRRLMFDLEPGRFVSLSRSADYLAKRSIIPPALHSAIRDILPAANSAVHGQEVPMDQAAEIVRLGDDVVRLLRGISSPKVQAHRQG